MAKSKIDKEDVATAIRALKQDGKKPTMASIRAALGNQGSLTTIQQFKKELDDEAQAAKDSPEALMAFRSIWSSALQEGRRQREDEIRDLQDMIDDLSTDLKISAGDAIAYRTSVDEVTKQYESAVTTLCAMNADLAEAKSTSERNASKLINAIEQHHLDEQKLRDQISQSQARVHELELQLARVETKLEVANKG